MRRTAALPVMVALLALPGCSSLHGGGPSAANAGAHLPTVTATALPSLDVPSPSPSIAPSPTPSASPSPSPTVTPQPTPRSTPGATRITFSGALTGTLLNPSVSCEQNIPQGNAGAMSVTGTLADGSTHIVTIWSSAAHSPDEIYEGTAAGEIDWWLYARPVPGVTNFDWARGATVNAHLTAIKGGNAAPGTTIDVTGTITC